MVENSQPLSLANDSKAEKWFPSEAQIHSSTRKTWPKESENVTIKSFVCISGRFQAMQQSSLQSDKRPQKK